MTVTATSYTPIVSNGNGSTTVFNVTFQFYELLVTHIDSSGNETVWAETTNYTVTGGNGSTGSITAVVAPASGESLRIERATLKSQPRDYDLDNQVLEDALQTSDDKITMVMQELVYNNNRRPALSHQTYASTGALTFPAASASAVLGWNGAGDALVNIDLVDLDGVSISAMPTVASTAGADLFVIYSDANGANRAITRTNLFAEISAGITPEYADNVFRIQDNGDATKEVAFEVSEITTDTTRTITVPDSDVDLGDIADKAVTATLASTSNGAGASLIGLEDSAGNTTETDVEGAIAELYGLAGEVEIFHAQDQKTKGTSGGNSSTSGYPTRTLNTVVLNEITGASLASNQITLPAGTYEAEARSPFYSSVSAFIQLYNDSDSSVIARGPQMNNRSPQLASGFAHVYAKFTLAAEKTIEVQYRASGSATDGLGREQDTTGDIEIYTDIIIRKVA